ncbi:MAG: CaiB/BaiF CoA transferase family protein [Acidimicrobiales bacterium]
MSPALPLSGITVVSIEQAVAAPYATRQLADLGARVIKVERPGGGDFARDYDETVRGLASYFVWLNRSKESLTLDLKHPEAGRILSALLDRADVFIQNLAPGATAKLGLAAADVRKTRPSLIACDVSGYGSSGPYRDKKAYDLLVQCETGVLSVTGTPESPAKVGISIADIAAGMYAYSAVLTALYVRERTGEGAACEVSLFDSLMEWMGHPIYYGMYTGRPPDRSGTSHASIAPYGSFRTGTGTVQLGIQNEREWNRFCEIVLDAPGVATDARFETNTSRVVHRDELVATIEAALADLSAEQVIARLDAAQIANARLNEVSDVIDHPQLSARDRWTEVDSPVGPIRALRPPVYMSGVAERMDPIPTVGQHTDAILAELGYDAAAIARLRDGGAV